MNKFEPLAISEWTHFTVTIYYSFQDDIEKPKPKISIPVLAAGSSSNEPLKVSKEITIQAIEAKLKMLESKPDDFEINKTISDEVPLIHKYQFNKTSVTDLKSSTKQSTRYNTKTRYNNLHHKRHKRWVEVNVFCKLISWSSVCLLNSFPQKQNSNLFHLQIKITIYNLIKRRFCIIFVLLLSKTSNSGLTRTLLLSMWNALEPDHHYRIRNIY